MIREITFSTENDKQTNKALVKKYFIDQGFILKSESAEELNFTRGNYLLNMVTFNPLKWKSNIVVSFQRASMHAFFDISTFGQTISKKENQLWDVFISNLKQAVLEKKDFAVINKASLHETKKSSYKLIGLTILITAIFAIPAGIIAHNTNQDNVFFIGICLGLSSFFILKDKI
jgi:hypothetical protein